MRCRPRREFRKAKCRCGVGTDRDGGAAKGGTDPMVRLPSGGHACAPGMRPGAALFPSIKRDERKSRALSDSISMAVALCFAMLCLLYFTWRTKTLSRPVRVARSPHPDPPQNKSSSPQTQKKGIPLPSSYHTILINTRPNPNPSTHPPPDAFQSHLEHTGVKGRRALDPLAPGRPGAIVVVVVFPGEQQLLVGDPRGEVPVVGCWWWLWWCFG